MKRYFENEDAENCYPEVHFQDEMKDEGLSEMTVLEAIPLKSSDYPYMYCKLNGCGEKGNCGKNCDTYEPRNGKSGLCKFQGRLFEFGNEIILTAERRKKNKK